MNIKPEVKLFAGLAQLFAAAVDYYHGVRGGFGDILLFYGGGEKESLKIWLAINGLTCSCVFL